VGQAESLNIFASSPAVDDVSGDTSDGSNDHDDGGPLPCKRPRLGLFASYSTKKTVANNTVVGVVSVRRLVIDYIEFSSELSVTRE